MKKLYIKKIHIKTIALPLFLMLLVITLIAGSGFILITMPVTSVETLSSDGVIATEVTSHAPAIGGPIIGVFVTFLIKMLTTYFTILIGLLLFNLLCKYTGGIGIDIHIPKE